MKPDDFVRPELSDTFSAAAVAAMLAEGRPMQRLPAALTVLLLAAACSLEPIPLPETMPMAPVDVHGSGEIACSAYEPSYDRSCRFLITRGAGGSAALQVLNPTLAAAEIEDVFASGTMATVEDAARVLIYQSGIWSAADGVAVETDREGDTVLIGIDETEFYAVPHSLLVGNS